MFATIINDVYRKESVNEIAKVLDELCSPKGAYGWASDGIYSYWDYNTKEVYYIGLAVDLRERFKQHNGIITTQSGNKKELIDKHFEENNELGFSIFVQSPMSQPYIKGKSEKWVWKDLKGEDRENHKIAEGILLECYKKKHGHFPKWNKVGGSAKGQKRVRNGNYEIIKGFTSTEFHPLVSRTSLRELAKKPEYEGYENGVMHAVRMIMLYSGFNLKESIDIVKTTDTLNRFERMRQENYLFKTLEYGTPGYGTLVTEKDNPDPELTTFNFKPYPLRKI